MATTPLSLVHSDRHILHCYIQYLPHLETPVVLKIWVCCCLSNITSLAEHRGLSLKLSLPGGYQVYLGTLAVPKVKDDWHIWGKRAPLTFVFHSVRGAPNFFFVCPLGINRIFSEMFSFFSNSKNPYNCLLPKETFTTAHRMTVNTLFLGQAHHTGLFSRHRNQLLPDPWLNRCRYVCMQLATT